MLRRKGKSKDEEGYGRGRAAIADGDDVLLDQEDMVETLMACINAPDYQPPTLPTVATDLMRLSQQSDVEIDDVVALLEQDSMIAGRILKLVQSPIYSGASPLASLRDALMRLGLNTLRDIVMEIAMNLKVFRSDDYADTMELLRKHSSATAQLSKMVSKHTEVDAEFGFLAGLLHDVGIAGTLLALSERKGARKTPPDLISIWPAVDRVHQHAGALMAERWELPEPLRVAIGAHHQVLVGGEVDPLAATLAVADDLAHECGAGVVPKEDEGVRVMTELERDCVSSHSEIDRCTEKTLETARSALGIGEDVLASVREEFEALQSD